MLIKSEILASKLKSISTDKDPLIICPSPDISKLEKSGSASIDLKLGCWFAVLRQSRSTVLDIRDKRPDDSSEKYILKKQYIRMGEKIFLHPNNFILGVTLEWIRMPSNIAGYVTSRSSWGRRGLIIATAIGVHPGFAGCLTLELYNAGQMPIALYPGMALCQLFMHNVDTATDSKHNDKSCYIGKRQPLLGEITLDEIEKKLLQKNY